MDTGFQMEFQLCLTRFWILLSDFQLSYEGAREKNNSASKSFADENTVTLKDRQCHRLSCWQNNTHDRNWSTRALLLAHVTHRTPAKFTCCLTRQRERDKSEMTNLSSRMVNVPINTQYTHIGQMPESMLSTPETCTSHEYSNYTYLACPQRFNFHTHASLASFTSIPSPSVSIQSSIY